MGQVKLKQYRRLKDRIFKMEAKLALLKDKQERMAGEIGDFY